MEFKKFSTGTNGVVEDAESRFITFELDLAGKQRDFS